MTDLGRRVNRLTAAEALRALYIDFEGRIDEPPVLLGVHRRGRGAQPYVQQDVVDPTFEGLVPRYMPLRDAVANVVQRAVRRDRRIVAWSEHELTVVRTLASSDPDLVAEFETRFVNALAFAKYWRNKLHAGDRPEEGRLADYLDLVGYRVPSCYGPGNVGETIRVVRARLERGLPLTDGQHTRWHNLVEHNRHDCAGMRAVCLRATRELEAP